MLIAWYCMRGLRPMSPSTRIWILGLVFWSVALFDVPEPEGGMYCDGRRRIRMVRAVERKKAKLIRVSRSSIVVVRRPVWLLSVCYCRNITPKVQVYQWYQNVDCLMRSTTVCKSVYISGGERKHGRNIPPPYGVLTPWLLTIRAPDAISPDFYPGLLLLPLLSQQRSYPSEL